MVEIFLEVVEDDVQVQEQSEGSQTHQAQNEVAHVHSSDNVEVETERTGQIASGNTGKFFLQCVYIALWVSKLCKYHVCF